MQYVLRRNGQSRQNIKSTPRRRCEMDSLAIVIATVVGSAYVSLGLTVLGVLDFYFLCEHDRLNMRFIKKNFENILNDNQLNLIVIMYNTDNELNSTCTCTS